MITLGSNIASLMAKRQLGEATHGLTLTFMRLFSGLGISHIGDTLDTDVSLYAQAIRNLNERVSALSIADNSFAQLSNIVTRIKELAEEAANGTLTCSLHDAEVQARQSSSRVGVRPVGRRYITN
jgi:flagellin